MKITKYIGARVSVPELEKIRSFTDKKDLSISQFIRHSIRNQIQATTDTESKKDNNDSALEDRLSKIERILNK